MSKYILIVKYILEIYKSYKNTTFNFKLNVIKYERENRRGVSMARINGTGIVKGRGGKSTEKSSGKTSSRKADTTIDIKHTSFVDKMLEISANVERGELQKSIDDIKYAGEKLVRFPTLKGLEEYQEMVKLFLNEALKKIYKVESKEGLTKPGQNKKVYTYVSRVDELMEAMVFNFVKEQKKALGLVDTINEIQGLLCSILA